MQIKKILDKIYTKADQIDALHHKASLLCDDIKDLATDLEFTDNKTSKIEHKHAHDEYLCAAALPNGILSGDSKRTWFSWTPPHCPFNCFWGRVWDV